MSTPGTKGRTAVAVVGIGAMFPGRGTTAGFWRDIVEATDTSSEVPATHWLVEDFYDPDPSKPDKTYCKRGAFIPAFPFDPVEFGTPPTVVETTDTVQLVALYVAKQVLAQATRTRFQQIDPEKTSVVLGVAAGTELIGDMASRLNRPVWIKAMREGGLSDEAAGAIADRISGNYTEWRESTFPGLLGNVVAGRITNRLDLGGVNFTADAACASALAAVRHAVHELVLGESDLVLAGGADALNNLFMYMCFSKTPAMSPTGLCRPFSDAADGTLLGEGCGIFALRRLEDAERDGNDIYAVIRGVGGSSDGRAKSVYAPSAGGQALALSRAYGAAGYSPATVELVEAHGTGTRAGDTAEFEGLRQVFAAADPAGRQWCALGSVKSQIGHTKSAAGAAGMMKAVMALHHRVLPPTIHVKRPNPALKLAQSPFYLNTATRPWVRAGDQPRRAAVSSFGFGGSNFHVTLEEYRGPGSRPPRLRTQPTELFLFSAASRDALAGKAQACLAAIRSDADLGHHARHAQAAFSPAHACRLAVVAGSIAELEERLAKALPRVDQQPSLALPDIAMAAGKAEPGKIAFLFAGQGSQYPGMGGDLAIAFETARLAWDEAATLTPAGAAPPHAVTFPIPAFDEAAREAQASRLTATENAQPAIATVALAQLALLAPLGLKPDLVAGHSFGEVMALHAAGAFDRPAALRLARARGEAMAAAAAGSEGAMLAVSASREAVEAKLALLPSGIVIANDNGPLQVILSGPKAAIEEAERRLPGLGLSGKRLRVGTAFHSPMVAPAAAAFGRSLKETQLATPTLPVYANATGEAYPAGVESARDLLAQQLARAVRFRDMIEALYRDGARTFVEIGPGAVLTGLVGQILGDRRHLAVAIDDRKKHGVTALHGALGRLAVAGIPMALDALWSEAPPAEPLPAPKKHVIMLNGANYGKPYPPRAGVVPPPAAAPAIVEAKAIEPPPLPAPAPDVTPPMDQPVNQSDEGNMDTPALAQFRAMHDGIAAEHRRFVEAMTQSHLGFLQTSERLLSRLGGDPLPAAAAPAPAEPSAPAPTVELATAPAAQAAPPAAASPVAAPPLPATPSAATIQLVAGVVAEKTGYPPEMLELDMDLEAELGIDSIKQVEILARLRETLPGMPEIDPAQLAELRTIAKIAAAIDGASLAAAPAAEPLAAVQPAAPVAPVAPAAPAATASSGAIDLVRSVVAEKTGYPPEMLEVDMDLEAELGIDSIKQVEILARLRESLPAMPEIDPAQLAELRTIAKIAAAIEGADLAPAAAAAPAPPVAPVVTLATPPANASSGATDLVRSVVAEKTGYPPEMLELDMDLEAELGIDSIKQVEILARLRESLPAMPEIDPAQLAELRTIAKIAAAIDGAKPAPAPAAVRPAAEDSWHAMARQLGLFRQVVDLAAAPRSGRRAAWADRAKRAVITREAPELAALLAEELARHNLPAVPVDQVPPDADVVICTAGLAGHLVPEAVHLAALKAARTVAPAFARNGGVFITLQDTDGTFGRSLCDVAAAWRGGLTGLVKTAAQEWPAAEVKAIDIACPATEHRQAMRRVAEEILSGGDAVEVGLPRDGQRLVPLAAEAPLPAHALQAPRPGSVILVTGGGRGITSSVVARLAAHAKLRFVLVGRSAILPWPQEIDPTVSATELKGILARGAQAGGATPGLREIGLRAAQLIASREIEATLRRIHEAGSEATYLAADITSQPAVAALVARVRRTIGPVNGLIHAAGVLADKYIADKTDEQFQRVFAAKVGGLQHLLAALAGDPLDFVSLFASVAGRFGNVGQADYAMANEVLNRVAWALARQRPGCRVAAINWGPWEGGMVTDALRESFKARDITTIPLDIGAEFFVRKMLSPERPHPEVVFAGLPGASFGKPPVAAAGGRP